MTPREFYDRYGPPIVTTVVAPMGGALRIKESLDRYLIGFNCTSANLFVRFEGPLGVGTGGINVVTNSVIWFTHHDYGALVTAPFILSGNGGPATVVVIEGFMRDAEYLWKERDQHAQRKETTIARKTRNKRINNSARKSSESLPSDTIWT